jgi:hypothetical protein
MTSTTPRVLVFASDIGAALGWNPYTSRKEVALKIAQATFPDARLGVVDAVDQKVANVKRLARDTPAELLTLADSMGLATQAKALRSVQKEVLAAALADTPQASALAHAVVNKLATPGSGTTTRASLAAAERGVEKQLGECSARVKTEVMAAVKSTTYTSRGIRDEASGLALFGSAAKLSVAPGSGAFQSRLVFRGVAVGGKEDGRVLCDCDGKTQEGAVVEIKRRQHKFFADIPPRELSQLYVYMFVHNVHTGYWVQLLDGEVRFREVAWDGAYWDRIVTGLRRFHAVLKPYLQSEDHTQLLMSASDDLGLGTEDAHTTH